MRRYSSQTLSEFARSYPTSSCCPVCAHGIPLDALVPHRPRGFEPSPSTKLVYAVGLAFSVHPVAISSEREHAWQLSSRGKTPHRCASSRPRAQLTRAVVPAHRESGIQGGSCHGSSWPVCASVHESTAASRCPHRARRYIAELSPSRLRCAGCGPAIG